MNIHNKLIKEQSFEQIRIFKEGKTSTTENFLEIRKNLLEKNNNQHDIYSLPITQEERLVLPKNLSVVAEEDTRHIDSTQYKSQQN